MTDYQFIKGQKIAVALSGGEDSMSLLYYLYTNKEKLGIEVCAVNIEHGIRGTESVRDSEFCRNYCEKLGIPFYPFKADALKHAEQNKMSVEAAARLLRYEIFAKVIKDKLADKIATAHHMQDNTESILLNIFRGAGVSGLKGISEYQNIIRPFLKTEKSKITEYAEKNKIPFVKDQTNDQTKYLRNYLRRIILPHIYEKFPAADSALQRLCENAQEDSAHFDKALKKIIVGNSFEIIKDKALCSRAVIKILKNLNADEISAEHINAVYKLQFSRAGGSLNLPNGITAYNDYGKIVFEKQKQERGELIIKTVKKPDFKDGFLYADAGKLGDYALRSRQEKDYITPFGGRKKSLKRYLIDKKIKQRERDALILFARENEILIIAGVEISDKVKITKDTKNILKIGFANDRKNSDKQTQN